MYPQKNSYVDVCIINKICTFVMSANFDIGVCLAAVSSIYITYDEELIHIGL